MFFLGGCYFVLFYRVCIAFLDARVDHTVDCLVPLYLLPFSIYQLSRELSTPHGFMLSIHDIVFLFLPVWVSNAT